MNVIIDVSGVAEILFKKEKEHKFKKVINEADIVFAPDLYVSELTNTLWKYFSKKILTYDECIKHIQNGLDYIDAFIDSKTIWEESFSEGISNNHSVYDMFYMVAARRHAGTLITNDSTLAAICKKNHVQVCW
jgi:predicted nucleic acid-binding protein